MKANILSDKEMREIGFTDYNKSQWYLCRIIDDDVIKGRHFETTFNLTIDKKTCDAKIEILDEAFLQPIEPNEKMRIEINKIKEELCEKGILWTYKSKGHKTYKYKVYKEAVLVNLPKQGKFTLDGFESDVIIFPEALKDESIKRKSKRTNKRRIN